MVFRPLPKDYTNNIDVNDNNNDAVIITLFVERFHGVVGYHITLT